MKHFLIALTLLQPTAVTASRLGEAAMLKFVVNGFTRACDSRADCVADIAQYSTECFVAEHAKSSINVEGHTVQQLTADQVREFHTCLVRHAGRDHWQGIDMVRYLFLPTEPSALRGEPTAGRSVDSADVASNH